LKLNLTLTFHEEFHEELAANKSKIIHSMFLHVFLSLSHSL